MTLKDKKARAAYCRKYYRKNRSRILKQTKKRQKTSEVFKEYQRRYRKSPLGRYKHMVASAKRFKRPVDLTFNEWQKVVAHACVFCGTDDVLGDFGSGIDRIDSNEGYVSSNVQSCCGRCNKMKLNFKDNDFIQQCKQIAQHSSG